MQKTIIYKGKKYKVTAADSVTDAEIVEALDATRAHEENVQTEDIVVKDIPVNAPEETVNIRFTGRGPKGGREPVSFNMVESAYKDRAKDNGKTLRALIEAVIESLNEDIANSADIVSGEMKPTRKLLLEDYIKVERIAEKAGLADLVEKMKPLVDKLSETLNLNYWAKPKFTKASRRQASRELRNKHRYDSTDSVITKEVKPVFLCTKNELTKSYNDAKSGRLTKVFEANLDKVLRDITADYDRINNGRDTYVEDPRIAKTLPEIIDLYQTARDYADDLEYSDYAKEIDFMLDTIKRAWGLAGI